MATNTVLIDCNQQESVEARSDNATSNAMWTNKVSEGLMLTEKRSNQCVMSSVS